MDGQVFISYSRKDSDFADQLSRALSAKGLKTWMDVGAIQIGAMWREEIVHAIEGSSYFVVILSCHSIRSENVVKELSIAESADKVILPVLIDDVSLPAQMKYQLVGVQFIRFQSYSFEQGVESLLAGMQASAGRGSGKALLDSICADRDYQLQQVLSLSRNLSTFRVHNGKRKRTEVLKLIAGATTQEFRDEALRLDALRLQGVPRLHDHFQHESWYCLVQEDIQAVSWDTMTWTDQSLEDSVVKILAILSDVHAANIIHADIHPGNLLVDPGSSDVFLVGFGLPCTAVSPDDKYSDLSFVDVPGPAVPRAWADGDEKHYFNAPELARFDAINSAIDIYSLAVSVLVSRTGLAPSQLYDIGAGSWCLDALAPSLRSWLAPMLSESPEVRRSGVKAFLDQHAVPSAGDHGSPRILDGCIGHSASVLPGSDASPPTSPSSPDVPRTASASVWRRDDLLEQLRLKIGPIAQLFLEDAPEDLSSNDVRQLIDQLVGHGIDARQLDQIAHDAEITVETKLQPAPQRSDASIKAPEMASQPQQASLIATDPGTTPRAHESGKPKLEGVYQWLLESIGPAAQLIWDKDFEAMLIEHPESVREKLTSLSLDHQIINELLQRAQVNIAAATSPSQSTGFPAALQSTPSKKPATDSRSNAPTQPLRPPAVTPEEAVGNDAATGWNADAAAAIVVEELGPMGVALLEECLARAGLDQLITCLASRLRQLGVEEAIIGTLNNRLAAASEPAEP